MRVQLANIVKSYGAQVVLDDVALSIELEISSMMKRSSGTSLPTCLVSTHVSPGFEPLAPALDPPPIVMSVPAAALGALPPAPPAFEPPEEDPLLESLELPQATSESKVDSITEPSTRARRMRRSIAHPACRPTL